MAKEWQVTFAVRDPGVTLTEHLRYAGAVGIRGDGHTGLVPTAVEQQFADELRQGAVLVTIHQPRGIGNGRVWASQNAARMKSFMMKAIPWQASF